MLQAIALWMTQHMPSDLWCKRPRHTDREERKPDASDTPILATESGIRGRQANTLRRCCVPYEGTSRLTLNQKHALLGPRQIPLR